MCVGVFLYCIGAAMLKIYFYLILHLRVHHSAECSSHSRTAKIYFTLFISFYAHISSCFTISTRVSFRHEKPCQAMWSVWARAHATLYFNLFGWTSRIDIHIRWLSARLVIHNTLYFTFFFFLITERSDECALAAFCTRAHFHGRHSK